MGFTTSHTVRIGHGWGAPEFYKYDKFLWTVSSEQWGVESQVRLQNKLHGPYCAKPGCRSQLDRASSKDDGFEHLRCPLCTSQYSYPGDLSELHRKALLSYESKSRESWPVVALDQPPADLQARDEDETYWLAARIGTKNGKKVGVVYFGEKKEMQGKRDYAQLFVDLDDEQIRHDPSNMDPATIAAKFVVEFKESTTTKKVL